MSTCPKCGHTTPSHDAKLRALFAARVGKTAKLTKRSLDAAHNELVTALRAAGPEDCIDPRSACPELPRPVASNDASVPTLGQGEYSMSQFARALGLEKGGAL